MTTTPNTIVTQSKVRYFYIHLASKISMKMSDLKTNNYSMNWHRCLYKTNASSYIPV